MGMACSIFKDIRCLCLTLTHPSTPLMISLRVACTTLDPSGAAHMVMVIMQYSYIRKIFMLEVNAMPCITAAFTPLLLFGAIKKKCENQSSIVYKQSSFLKYC